MAVKPRHPNIGSPRAAADMAGVHINTVYRWCADGYIQAQKIGPRFWRIDLDALAAQLGGSK
ncbi:hypothetical protein BH09ACT7_BH09ACT7_18270 [soil metagenome]